MMPKAPHLISTILLSILVIMSLFWGSLVIAYLLPIQHQLAVSIAVLLWCFACGMTLWQLWRKSIIYLPYLLPYTSILLLIFVGWLQVTPSQDRIWADDVAQMLNSDVQGDNVTLYNVRNFNWRSETDYTRNWETRQYQLSKLERVDLALSYWMGPAIAHTLVSFGFSDGRYLTFSIEIRKERHESFSAIAGFFKQFETSLIAADERDILYVRTNVRDEDVYLYQLNMSADARKALFLAYLAEAEQLRQQPRFYNTLTENCTTIVFKMVQRIVQEQQQHALPLDYRLLASGYLPEYLYDINGFISAAPLDTLRQQGRITHHALAAPVDINSADFSQLIREEAMRHKKTQ